MDCLWNPLVHFYFEGECFIFSLCILIFIMVYSSHLIPLLQVSTLLLHS